MLLIYCSFWLGPCCSSIVVFGWVRVPHLFSFLCYVVCIVCLHSVSCVPSVDNFCFSFIFPWSLKFCCFVSGPSLISKYFSDLDVQRPCNILYEKRVRTIHFLVLLYLHTIHCRIVAYVLRYWIVFRFLCFVIVCFHPVSCVPSVDSVSGLCLHPVSCVPSVDSLSGLFVFFLYLVCPVLTVSLDCLSSSCILCAQCF